MKTADPELMRAINRFLVLDTIRRQGAIARVEIGTRTELSPTTVSAITASLLDDGLITVLHEGDIRSQSARGRPRVMLVLKPEAAFVVGVRLAADRIICVVTNFQGDVLASRMVPMRAGPLTTPVIASMVTDGVRACLQDAGLHTGQIKALALSLPGIVEHGTGRVLASSVLSDLDASLRDAIVARLGIDTIVESDANAIAMAQHWFGNARNHDDFVLVAIGEIPGLGVMHGGQLFRGAHGLSLALGDVVMGARTENGERLAELASDRVILSSPEAAARAGMALGIAIANLMALFAPPRIIIAGSETVLGALPMAPLRQAFAAAVPASLAALADIVVDVAGDELWARGAAAVALGELYGSPWGTTGPARRAIIP